jgi:taurine transport system permease protein
LEEKELNIWSVVVLGSVGLLTFLVIWEMLVSLGVIDPYFLPSPSSIVKRAVQMTAGKDAVLFYDIRMSATRVLTGFFLSALVGVPFGLVMGMSSTVRALLSPIISIIRPLPALSWIPLSMLWLGIDEQQKYAIVFMGCFASILVYTTDATMRVAWTCVISAEMVGANSGLGFRIWTAKEWSDTGQVLVGMISISVTVLILDILFRGLERLLLPWQRREVGT